ncbi:energy-coupling factor transport system substrate-specific component [Lachnospiraceae bacterium NE2001]|nr:energy-coupling factor transport system substrate-specific component [Lachnospiraceae bacterium NE2001]
MTRFIARLISTGRSLYLMGLLAVFILVFGNFTVYAETISGDDNDEVAVDPTGKGDGYAAVLYNNTNGLPTSEANALAETREGFIWIGSYSGLIRYDGNTFDRIDSTTGIASVVSLYVDNMNRLWIGTNDNGVAVMEDGEFTFYQEEDGLGSSSVRAIVEDKKGNIFVGTTDGISIIDTEMKMSSIDESLLSDTYICELRLGVDGVIYGETRSGAIFTIEDKKISACYDPDKLGVGSVYTVYPDPGMPGYVYIGTEGSEIYHGNLADGLTDVEIMDASPLDNITSIEKFQGVLWVCSDTGIGYFQDGDFSMMENIPLNNSIDNMLVDYEGNLWFNSSRQGVMKVVPNQFTDVSFKYGLPDMVVNSTCRLGGKLFVGTDTGLVVLDKYTRTKYLKIKSLETDVEEINSDSNLIALFDGVRIRSIIRDSKDRIWFSTYSDLGLVRYDNGDVKTFTTANGMPADKVRVISERSDGTIMAACSGGLAIIDGDEVTEVYDTESGISNTEILTVVEGENGDILLGSDGNGIYKISNGRVTNLGKENGLRSEVVMRIKKDISRDIYWIVTSNSIAYMQNDTITTVKKFPYSNNFDLYENTYGEMWIFSSNGIYVVPVDDLIANGDIDPVYYGRENGLPCVTTANSYSDIGESGVLYVSGVTGVFKVNIDEHFEDVSEIKMAVPFVEADGEIIYPDKNNNFNIKPEVKRVTIYPYVYTYSMINPQVTYSLEGFDTEAKTVKRTELEPIDYTNLIGGTYTFEMSIKTALGDGNKSLKITIEKEKAVYEKFWFKALLSFLLFAIIVAIFALYVRRKTKALVKKQQENKEFIREMIEAFAKTIDMKDEYTNGHSTRVAEYTAMLAEELGYEDDDVEKYYNIALLHDIGKIAIPPEVLNKPGKLTDEEFNIIKSHSARGYKVLKDISIMPELAIGAGAHHERPDGKGYPKGLKGDEIPRVAQIIAVADTFDAMYSDRPYRKRMNFEKAVSIIKEVSGTQLQADVVDAFLRLVDKGEFRAPDDTGGGTTEDINNIHKQQIKYEEQKKKLEEKLKSEKNEET